MKVKHKFLNVLLAVCMVFSMTPAAVFAEDNVPEGVWTDYAAESFGGGTGTEEEPYQITTAEELAKLSKDVSNGNAYEGVFFELTDNIDLSGHRWVPIGIYKSESENSAINSWFEGFIDGNNKTISGLYVDERTDKNAAGFFGNIRNVSVGGNPVGAKDLTISNAKIYGDDEGYFGWDAHAGILAGYALSNAEDEIYFENITVSGNIEIEDPDGNNTVGGMIGYGCRIKAKNCKAENISIKGPSNSGGFIGLDTGSDYENCKASGTISGLWGLGGFVGYTSTATLNDSSTQSVFKKCAADVEIEGSDWRLGGFAGYAEYGQFDTCVAFGDVTSTVTGWEPRVGGFIGESDNAIVNHCYTAGKVNSSHSGYKAGGFVGHYAGGTFTDCSFDSAKNSVLTAAGVDKSDGSSSLSDGVKGINSSNILTNICANYYGGHKYSTEWTIDTPATCTAGGSKSHHCELCDAKTDITDISATSHTLTKTEAKPATCTEDGYEAYWTCKNCAKLFSDEAGQTEIDEPVTIPKTGHTYSNKLTFDETGHWKATTCGHDNEEGVLDIQPHTWDAGKVTKEATETEEGVKTYTCSVCGTTRTEVIPKEEAATPQPPKKGDVVTDDKGTGNYKVTDVAKKEVAYQIPANKKATTISVPATVTIGGVTYKVTSIADNAFANNKKLTKVTIGSNVTAIGTKAFYKCTSLKKLTIPSKVKKIGKQAFYGCKKLKSIAIKTTKLTGKNVGSSAFKGIYAKAAIQVPKSKLTSYKKLLKAKGVSSKAKIKK